MSVSLIDGHIDDDVQITDREVIFGLNCCGNNEEYDTCKFCGDCEFASYGEDCQVMLFAKSIDLIKKQQAEIKSLNGTLKAKDTVLHFSRFQGECDAEIVKTYQNIIIELFTAAIEDVNTARVEAIKEFAEKVKGFMDDVPMHSEEDFIYVDYFELRDKIDNLVNEMVGEASG